MNVYIYCWYCNERTQHRSEVQEYGGGIPSHSLYICRTCGTDTTETDTATIKRRAAFLMDKRGGETCVKPCAAHRRPR